jgi:hypothetical protein
VFPAKLGHRHAAFGLAQDRKDLGFAISRHLHLNLLVYLAEKILLPQPLTFGGDYRCTANAEIFGHDGRLCIRCDRRPDEAYLGAFQIVCHAVSLKMSS